MTREPSTVPAATARRTAGLTQRRLYTLTVGLAIKAALVIALLPGTPPVQAADPASFAQAAALFDRAAPAHPGQL